MSCLQRPLTGPSQYQPTAVTRMQLSNHHLGFLKSTAGASLRATHRALGACPSDPCGGALALLPDTAAHRLTRALTPVLLMAPDADSEKVCSTLSAPIYSLAW